MTTTRILVGDALARLRDLPDESVQCVVTSPPYYGLRDYGTASWDGGDVDCDHRQLSPERIAALTRGQTIQGSANKADDHEFHRKQFRDVCGKCGAHRVDDQIGLEPTPAEYVARMVAVFAEVRRVLRSDGVCWLNLGDSYNNIRTQRGPGQALHGRGDLRGKPAPLHSTRGWRGLKEKDLIGIPWRVAFALQADGWWLRSDIVWAKPSCMPESVRDRPTRSHEYVFLLTKSARYFYDADAIREEGKGRLDRGEMTSPARLNQGAPWKNEPLAEANGRNARTVWTIPTQPFSEWTETVRRVPVEPGDADGDTTRTTSPDCRVHGDQPAPASSAPGGERAADLSARTGRSDARPAPAQPAAPAGSDPPREPGTVAGSSGSPPPECAPAATPRSTGTRRTGPAPETTSPCTPSGRSPAHTGGTSTGPASASPSPSGSPAGSTVEAPEPGPEAGNPDRNRDTSASLEPSCTCSFYREVTERTSHFAVMAPGLAERCIRAGTSERGACPECGAPWERVVERGELREQRSSERAHGHLSPQGYTRAGGSRCGVNDVETTGWRPTCDHDAEPVPCVTLDCFGGAGTTAVVANRLGRDAVLIELSPEYAEMARSRVYEDAPMFRRVVVE